MSKIALVLLVAVVVMLGCTTPAPQPNLPVPQPTSPPSSTGYIVIATSLDDGTWLGDVSYKITGPRDVSGTSTPGDFKEMPAGDYTLTYESGGPNGAKLDSVTPSPSQTLTAGGTIMFTLHFLGQAPNTIEVFALLDDKPWSGSVNYTINGPVSFTESFVPKTLANVPPGTYTLTYTSGGPPGAALTGIGPGDTEILRSGMNTSYTLNFETK